MRALLMLDPVIAPARVFNGRSVLPSAPPCWCSGPLIYGSLLSEPQPVAPVIRLQGGWFVTLRKRELYRSSNGDCWLLVRDGPSVFIWHQPNTASGGRASHIDIGTFLSVGRGPEQQALLHLIGTLVEESS